MTDADPAEQGALFADLWRPGDSWIIVLGREREVGWVEARQTGTEIFLKQLYVVPAYQRQGIGTRVIRRLLEGWGETARSMALFVLKNNPATRFYGRLGFSIVQETRAKFVMRRELADGMRARGSRLQPCP